jgi:RNA polymerase sigma factor (TIGR02999 family)
MTEVPPHPTDAADPSAPHAAWTRTFYAELQGVAQRLFAAERRDHTLQPTAVVHEACLRMLAGPGLPELPRHERLALGARVLRQVLVDHQRRHAAAKRGGSAPRVELDAELFPSNGGATWIELDVVQAALERLRELHPRQAELVTLRVFGGLEMAEIAECLGTSKRTAEADWAVARAWLRRELAGLAP